MRKTDTRESTYFRSTDRVYCVNGKWFFTTREVDHGPFPSEQSARVELQRYVDEMRFFDEIGPDKARLTSRQSSNDYANFSLVDKDAPG